MQVLPASITFEYPPCFWVHLEKGQLGYHKGVRISMRQDDKGRWFFPVRNERRYYQSRADLRIFVLLDGLFKEAD